MRKMINFLNSAALLFRKCSGDKRLKRVLLVSNTALGDTILSTPAIKSLRKNHPDIHIILMVNKKYFNFFKNFEYVDEVVVFDKGLFGLLKCSLLLRIRKIDTIFFLHSNGPQDLFIALFSGVCNILKAINYPGRVSQEFGKLMLNEVDYDHRKHIVEHRLDLVRCFNPNVVDKTLSIPSEFIKEDLTKESNTIALQLSAADIYKTWPLNNFVQLMNEIFSGLNGNCNVLLLGVATERALAQDFISKFEFKDKVKNLCGKTKLEQLPSILQQVGLLITNDTGTLHLAIAVSTPTISLFSATEPEVFGPYQDLDIHKVLCKDGSFINNQPKKIRTQEAMSLITVDEVLDVYKEMKKKGAICVE